MVASPAQLAALQKLRDKKAALKTEKEAGEGNAAPVATSTASKLAQGHSVEDKGVWFNALLNVMRSKEVKHPASVRDCIDVADEVLRIYKDKFK
jgi:hypothetical protein